MNELPNDSWFTEEQLDEQRSRNIHARFRQELQIDNPHYEHLGWWREVGQERYRDWQNDTHRCNYCDDLCFITEQLNRLSPTQEGEN